MSEEIARLADDLDLEIDEILPAVEYAVVARTLGQVADGRANLTDTAASSSPVPSRSRKTILRERLERTTLFAALLRALESLPERRLTDDQVIQLVSFTTAPADSLVQNIINWGRYAEMFRYDSDEHLLLPSRAKPSRSRPVPSNPASLRTGADEAPGHPREHPRERRTPRRAARHVRLTVSDTFARQNA